jgi:hypothetical protein
MVALKGVDYQTVNAIAGLISCGKGTLAKSLWKAQKPGQGDGPVKEPLPTQAHTQRHSAAAQCHR